MCIVLLLNFSSDMEQILLVPARFTWTSCRICEIMTGISFVEGLYTFSWRLRLSSCRYTLFVDYRHVFDYDPELARVFDERYLT
jgi:hypothetical protein